MHVYAVVHDPPVPGAPEPLTTVVAPAGLDRASLVELAATRRPDRVAGWRPYELTFPDVAADPAVALEQVRARYADCARCHLSESRTMIVHARGNPYATVALLGEGPGRDEDAAGLPFVGRSGRLQSELARDGGIDPDRDVVWLNAVGCRACNTRWDGDREPTLVERLACSERTTMLLAAIRPRVVVCLGRSAASMFWDEPPPVNSWATLEPPADPRDWVAVAHVRHPAFFLHAAGARHAYRDFAAGRLFWQALAARLPTLQKVAAWRFRPRYAATLQGPQAGP